MLDPGGESRHQAGTLALLAEPARVELRRRLGADDDLARRGEVLELEHPRRGRAGDEQLPVRLRGEEEMARAGVDAHRHAQLDRADRALGAADLLDRPLHVGGGARRALGVALAREEKEEGVAAELEHVAAVPLGDRDQVVEDRRDALHELLGARLPVHGEPLREGGEAGDVDRDQRAVDDLRRAVRRAPRSRPRTSRGRYGARIDGAEGVSLTSSASLFGPAATNRTTSGVGVVKAVTWHEKAASRWLTCPVFARRVGGISGQG